MRDPAEYGGESERTSRGRRGHPGGASSPGRPAEGRAPPTVAAMYRGGAYAICGPSSHHMLQGEGEVEGVVCLNTIYTKKSVFHELQHDQWGHVQILVRPKLCAWRILFIVCMQNIQQVYIYLSDSPHRLDLQNLRLNPFLVQNSVTANRILVSKIPDLLLCDRTTRPLGQ